MKMQEVVGIAKERGLKPGRGSKKADLIHMIQSAEGNCECYACETAASCDQYHCIWREDCLSDSKKMVYHI